MTNWEVMSTPSLELSEVTTPAVPRVRLDKVAIACSTVQQTLRRWSGFVITPGLARTLAVHVTGALVSVKHVDALTQTFIQYGPKTLDDYVIAYLSRQLVSRVDELARGPLLLHQGFYQSEWVPYEITGVTPSEWKNGLPAQILTLYALYGRPAGALFQKKLPESWLGGFAYKVGYSRRLLYPDLPQQFLGLRFWAWMTPDEENPKELKFVEWAIDPRMKKGNQMIIRRRNRIDLGLDETNKDGDPREWACPIDSDDYCEKCPKGLEVCNASYKRGSTWQTTPG